MTLDYKRTIEILEAWQGGIIYYYKQGKLDICKKLCELVDPVTSQILKLRL